MTRAKFNEAMKGTPPPCFLKVSIRFHLERRVGRGPLPSDDVWTRETLAGAKTISRARFDLRLIRKAAPSYFDKRRDWRIVKVTTTSEIVK